MPSVSLYNLVDTSNRLTSTPFIRTQFYLFKDVLERKPASAYAGAGTLDAAMLSKRCCLRDSSAQDLRKIEVN